MGHIYGLHDQFMARSLITLSLLTMNQNICFVLVAGTRYDCGVDVDCVELDLIFTPVDKSVVCPHLSPGVSLISDLAHDSGILQSELFTSRSQNLVLAKLPNSGFGRYSQFLK